MKYGLTASMRVEKGIGSLGRGKSAPGVVGMIAPSIIMKASKSSYYYGRLLR